MRWAVVQWTALWGALSFAAAALAQPDHICAGVHMPGAVTVAGRELVLNGMGKRTATVFRVGVYVAGLYLPERSSDPRHILDEVASKHLSLHFVRDVPAEEMAEALDKGVRDNVPKAELPAARTKLKQVVARLPALTKDLVLGFSQLPEGRLEIRSNGKSIAVIHDPELARLLFTVWLGPHPPGCAGSRSRRPATGRSARD